MQKKEKNNEKKVGYSISNVVETTKEKKFLNLESESTKFIVILLSIIAFIAVLWIVDSLRSNKKEDEEIKSVKINYSEVIVGNMLDQKYDNYFVYAYNKDEKEKDLIEYLLSSVEHLYKLDLDKANNLPAVAETSNFNGTIDKIKFKGTTLLSIEKGKIIKSYEGSDAIIEYLRSINK